MSKKFRRTVENFTCEHCRAKVTGNGYTNHCPECLWSKHVDVHPGDRLHACLGQMRPIRIEIEHGKQILVHLCQKCGIEKRNKVSTLDNFDALLKLSQSASV